MRTLVVVECVGLIVLWSLFQVAAFPDRPEWFYLVGGCLGGWVIARLVDGTPWGDR